MRMALLKSSDETVPQIKSKADPQTVRSDCVAWNLRNAFAPSDGSAAFKFPGKRPVAAVPLPESPVRMSIGSTVLEEVLLLQYLTENCVGQSEQSHRSGLRIGCR